MAKHKNTSKIVFFLLTHWYSRGYLELGYSRGEFCSPSTTTFIKTLIITIEYSNTSFLTNLQYIKL